LKSGSSYFYYIKHAAAYLQSWVGPEELGDKALVFGDFAVARLRDIQEVYWFFWGTTWIENFSILSYMLLMLLSTEC
jgi:hypothetical protein